MEFNCCCRTEPRARHFRGDRQLASVAILPLIFGVIGLGTVTVLPTRGLSQESTTDSGTEKSVEDRAEEQVDCENPELRRELLNRVQRDQQARHELLEWMRENPGQLERSGSSPEDLPAALVAVQKIDEENLQWIRKQIEQGGWPTHAQVSQDGAHAAWLIVQHCDKDPKFQFHCLELMKACPSDQVAQVDVAYLEDRVLLARGEAQVYGTQVEQVDGKWQPRSVVDPEKLDERRKAVGLPPIADYLKLVERMQSGARESAEDKTKTSGDRK